MLLHQNIGHIQGHLEYTISDNPRHFFLTFTQRSGISTWDSDGITTELEAVFGLGVSPRREAVPAYHGFLHPANDLRPLVRYQDHVSDNKTPARQELDGLVSRKK